MGQGGPGKERIWENLRPWKWFFQSREVQKNRHAECAPCSEIEKLAGFELKGKRVSNHRRQRTQIAGSAHHRLLDLPTPSLRAIIVSEPAIGPTILNG